MKDFSDVWQPGLSLPQAVYTDPVCFDADMARLMRDQWFLVDHASRIAKPGDYFLTQIGAESVIVTRNRAGEVKAFYNACRHRGSRVCLEREGSRRTFTCPYHAWTYDLDGALRSAQHMPEDFDRSQHGLKPVGVGEFEGLIFLNFAEPDQAPDFAAYTELFAPLLRGQGVARTKIAARKTYPTEANWKLVVENFFECYHCLPAHKTYCSVHDKMKMLAFGAGSGSGVGADIAAYMATLTNTVDENTIVYTDDAAVLAAGQGLFNEFCVACHGPDGAGSETSVGPNLTDAYWLHGGGVKNVFKTIKYGVPEKGMISWKSQLQPVEIRSLACYIISLEGKGSPTQKAPQGEMWKEAPSDSTATPADSTALGGQEPQRVAMR